LCLKTLKKFKKPNVNRDFLLEIIFVFFKIVFFQVLLLYIYYKAAALNIFVYLSAKPLKLKEFAIKIQVLCLKTMKKFKKPNVNKDFVLEIVIVFVIWHFFEIVFFQVSFMFYYIILLYYVFKKYFGLFIS